MRNMEPLESRVLRSISLAADKTLYLLGTAGIDQFQIQMTDATHFEAREYKPDAITLDIRLPMMDGWTVLDRLKHDPNTRHIPVHIITASEGKLRGLNQGAIAYLQKPVTRDALGDALANIKQFIERGVRNLLSEGGPTMHGALWAAGVVDELNLTIAPLITGDADEPNIVEGGRLPDDAELELLSVERVGSELFLRYGRAS